MHDFHERKKKLEERLVTLRQQEEAALTALDEIDCSDVVRSLAKEYVQANALSIERYLDDLYVRWGLEVAPNLTGLPQPYRQSLVEPLPFLYGLKCQRIGVH